MVMAAGAGSTAFNAVKPRLRLQPVDVQAAAAWGFSAGTFALYLIQPFDWLKRTFIDKPETT